MNKLKQYIAESLHEIVSQLSVEEIFASIETPPSGLGDYAFPCFKLSPILKKSPQQIAEYLKEKIFLPKEIEKAEVSGGYLNFFVSKSFLSSQVISEIVSKKQEFGLSTEGRGKTILVEFSSPNTNKPLHLGHSRNNSFGESICRLYESQGSKVKRVNLINDRGIHIAKSVLAFQKFGEKDSPSSSGLKGDYFVGKYYVLFNEKLKQFPELEKEAQELLVRYEKKDKTVLALWNKMNSLALEGFKETYQRTGISFDKFYYESELFERGKKLVEEGLRKKVFSKNEEGAVVAVLKEFNLPDKVVLRPDGTSIYSTQDIALIEQKFKDFNPSKSITVTASEQILYIKQIHKIAELLKIASPSALEHLWYGMVFLPEGKLKSREGKTVEADVLLDSLEELAKEEILKREPKISKPELSKRSKAIALSALKFHLLKIEAKKDFVFNPKESISFEGETGPYLLYSYARAKSILGKSRSKDFNADYSLLRKEKEVSLISLLSKYPEAVKDSLSSYSPHKLCHFLLSLAEEFNSFYQGIPVLKAEKEVQKARLSLVFAVSVALSNGLNLLGINVLEKM